MDPVPSHQRQERIGRTTPGLDASRKILRPIVEDGLIETVF